MMLRASHAHEKAGRRDWNLNTLEFNGRDGALTSIKCRRNDSGQLNKMPTDMVILRRWGRKARGFVDRVGNRRRAKDGRDYSQGDKKMPNTQPKQAGFSMSAEWAPHKLVYLAWPSAADLWLENLAAAQEEFIAFCKAVADLDEAGKPRGERMKVLVSTLKDGFEAEKRFQGLPVTIELQPFGDIWLRDTAPLFLKNESGEKAFARTAFNGWGGKYNLPHDPDLALRIGQASGYRKFETDWVLEGGSVELDGEGTCLTSRQCLLNPNRNPGRTEAEIETFLKDWLGCEKILWLDDGLLNDHTDGHIDTMARYVAPGVIACMQAKDDSDPNFEVMEEMARALSLMTDSRGRKIKVERVVSPGAVLDEEGDVTPASYLNFYIANTTIVVPTYGSSNDAEAVRQIAEIFARISTKRRTVGLSARAILTGGGAFHCMSQQEPV